MALTLTYGGYAHLAGECAVTINRNTQFSAAGVPFKEVATWSIRGRVEGDDVAAVKAELLKLEAAYRKHNQVARLTHSSGVIAHELSGAGSLTGVRVVQPPSFPTADGAEYTTYRNYVVTLECEFQVGNPNSVITSWSETLSFSGGGPDRGVIEVTDGAPVEYITRRQTAYRCTQTGQATGFLRYPLEAAVPVFPADLLEGNSHPVTYGNATLKGGVLVNWPVSWSFRFVSPEPLAGLPRTIPTLSG